MSNLTKEQQVAMDAAVGGLKQYGPMAELMTNAVRNTIAGMPASTEFYEAAAIAGSQGVDLLSAVQEQAGMILNAAPGTEISAAINAKVGEFKNMDTSTIQTLAMAPGGPDGALTLLEGKMGAIASGATDMAESTAQINTAMDDFSKAVASGALKMQGAAANVEEFMAESKALAVNSILESVGIDVTNIEAFQTGFAGLSESLTNLPDNEKFRELVSAAISAAFKLNGTTAVTGLLLDSQGVDRTTGEAERVAEASMLGSLAASAAGLEKFAAILARPMQGIVALDTLDSAGKITGIQALSDTADVVRSSLNGLVLSIDAATEAIYDSITNLETAHHSTGSN